MLFDIVTWDISPTIFEIFDKEIRWYSVLFALGLLILGPKIEEKIWQRERLNPEWMNSLYVYVVLGTIIGARLGHVLFYDPIEYLANPIKILAVWEGGLASHGGTLGIILAVWIYSRQVVHKPIVWTLDRLAVPVGLVAALIRLGNLMNSEIFGRLTDLPWAFRFVRTWEYHDIVARAKAGETLTTLEQGVLSGTAGWHPTQIYEALGYIGVFALCMWLYWQRDAIRYPGLILGSFLTGTFGLRIIVERIKNVQEPWELDLMANIGLNMGQLLSVPFVLVGLWLIARALRRGKQAIDGL
ncbi:MAG: prolipoprotein diacylglyceryl transferase [Porphyromonadaceae bacterium]|nr:prolipoprotein diacylglyceryl transferase [Porphyromonadaceae bacterium]